MIHFHDSGIPQYLFYQRASSYRFPKTVRRPLFLPLPTGTTPSYISKQIRQNSRWKGIDRYSLRDNDNAAASIRQSCGSDSDLWYKDYINSGINKRIKKAEKNGLFMGYLYEITRKGEE